MGGEGVLVLAGWLSLEDRLSRLTPRKVNCRLKESKLPTAEVGKVDREGR